MFFDSHAHYDTEEFDNDRDLTIENVYKSGVKLVVNPSSSSDSIDKVIDLSNKYDFIYCALGIDPNSISDMNDEVFSKIKNLSKNNKVVAIGEIGLDYHYDEDKETQKFWFTKQLQLAAELCLPVIIHDRDAHQDCFDLIMQNANLKVGGVFHCYSGSVEMAKEIIKNNFFISISGVVTFNNAKKLTDVVEHIPLEYLLIETDSPYLAPIPNRGKRNDSTNLQFIAQKIADIKNISVEEVANATMQNAKKLFKII